MDLKTIQEASARIEGRVKRTPLEFSQSLTNRIGVPVYVKYELFQKTGSFKARGAFNKLLGMSEEQRSRGVVAVSGGNHAQAVAYASASLGIDAVILMAENTPASYVEATRGYGGTVELRPNIADAFQRAKDYESEGRIFVHPFDDDEIMAGAGTVGLEIFEDLPDVTDVILSIGGGGLSGGVSTALKALKPAIRVWGVETVGADAMSQALAAGHPVELPAITSIAKTLGAPYVSEKTLELVRKNLESVTVVTDDETVEAMVFIAERLKVITEPAAACTLVAAEKLRENFGPESKVVLILCGGNTGVSDLCGYLTTNSSKLGKA
jgi:threonine dehydratase